MEDKFVPLKLEESWIYKVAVLADIVARTITPIVYRVSGLNLSQWRVIAAVADQPGCTATEVVAITPMDKGLVSRAVRTLVNQEIIARQSSEKDGRSVNLRLTKEGEKIYRDIVNELDKENANGRRILSNEDQARFLMLLEVASENYTNRSVSRAD